MNTHQRSGLLLKKMFALYIKVGPFLVSFSSFTPRCSRMPTKNGNVRLCFNDIKCRNKTHRLCNFLPNVCFGYGFCNMNFTGSSPPHYFRFIATQIIRIHSVGDIFMSKKHVSQKLQYATIFIVWVEN